MKYLIRQWKLPYPKKDQNETGLIAASLEKRLRCRPEQITSVEILKKSIDARKKPEIFAIYTLAVDFKTLDYHGKSREFHITPYHETPYVIPVVSNAKEALPPVIVGCGPAGLFLALVLAEAKIPPIVIERGAPVEERTGEIEHFFETGILDPESNVLFGEGGAGCFSDGKLNTLTKDRFGRQRFVLKTFVRFGAQEEILYDTKPHIGTDVLQNVLIRMRKELTARGTRFYFHTKMTDLSLSCDPLGRRRINGIRCLDEKTGEEFMISSDTVALAIGHSARDTFFSLYRQNVPMHAKEFAVGFRVEHPQEMISRSQYGSAAPDLPPAPYKLTAHPKGSRKGVYSFCMCPGGYVINSSSEQGLLAVNGMSYSSRDGKNANSAIIVSVGPEEFSMNDPLGGIQFQRELEKKAYQLASGKIPQQLYGDYKEKVLSQNYGDFESMTRGQRAFARLDTLLPPSVNDAFLEGMEIFGEKIHGFCRPDAILSGVESRTSSPVRIERDKRFMSEIRGLFPTGEGAGYAGGIMSAATDGMKTAEAILSMKRYS